MKGYIGILPFMCQTSGELYLISTKRVLHTQFRCGGLFTSLIRMHRRAVTEGYDQQELLSWSTFQVENDVRRIYIVGN